MYMFIYFIHNISYRYPIPSHRKMIHPKMVLSKRKKWFSSYYYYCYYCYSRRVCILNSARYLVEHALVNVVSRRPFRFYRPGLVDPLSNISSKIVLCSFERTFENKK